jgi:hypothetical protein
MDPATAVAALTIINTLITTLPSGIKAFRDIMVAWDKVDPTAEDFEALAILIGSKRPKDPLATP